MKNIKQAIMLQSRAGANDQSIASWLAFKVKQKAKPGKQSRYEQAEKAFLNKKRGYHKR